MNKKTPMLIITTCILILSVVIVSIPIAHAATTKVYILPAGTIGPGIGEIFTVGIYIEDVTNLTGWQAGLAWNASVLACSNWKTLFNTQIMSGPANYLEITGTIDNTTGQVYPPYSYGLKAGKVLKSGSDFIAEINFTVLDYGFTWINLTNVKVTINWDPTGIPLNVTDGAFALFVTPPAAPVASFSYSPSAPKFNRTVTFDASASVDGWNGTADVPIANYTWDFDDGNVTTTPNPIIYHTYTSAATYTVNLTVTCEYDPLLIFMGLTSDSTWKDVAITGPVHDVAVTSVTPSPTTPAPWETVYINVTVTNEGDFTENFTVTAYYDNTEIDTQNVTNLISLAEENLTFTWDTTDVDAGDYTIRAMASTVAGETDTADNTYIDGTVTVTAPDIKLYISPASIIGPPPDIGESFTINITIENVINFTAWQAGLQWDPTVLECSGWEALFRTQVMSAPGNYLVVNGTINNATGQIYPPYAYSLKSLKIPKSGSGTLAQIDFTVLDNGFTWINLTYVKVNINFKPAAVPVDVTDGTFRLVIPAAPVANFTYSPSAPEVDEQVMFDASASVPGWNGTADVPIANYTWDFDDGNTTTTTNPIIYHTYTTAATYTVNLTVTCEYDSVLVNNDLASDSTWKDVAITVVPIHDVAVTSVTPSPTEVTEGENVTITVIVTNEGDLPETFTVKAYYNITAIATKTVTNLASGATRTLSFTWDTTDVDEGDYTIRAMASTVAGETDTADNTLTADDTVTVKVSAAELPWLWIILAIIIIIAIIVIAYWMIRRKKTT